MSDTQKRMFMCFDIWDLYTNRCLEVKDQQVYVHSVCQECQFDQSLSSFPGGWTFRGVCFIVLIQILRTNKEKNFV